MRHGRSWTNSSYRRRFGINSKKAKNQLQKLVNHNYTNISNQRGSTSYTLASTSIRTHVDHTAKPTLLTDVATVSKRAPLVWSCLEDGPRTRRQIVEATSLTSRQATYALNRLKEAGLVIVDGGQGDVTTTYRRA